MAFALAGVLGCTGLDLRLEARVNVSRQNSWDEAVALRDQLEQSPPAQRTREQYEAVLNAFRQIYHAHPDAVKAPAAVAAVANLLGEKGRVLQDPRASRAAIGQYEFLRQQYPKSPQVDNALLLEAEICRQDLKDAACATEKFRAVIDGAPGTSFAEQASIELKEMQGGGKAVGSAAPAQNSKAPAQFPTVSAGPADSETIRATPNNAVNPSETSANSSQSHRIVLITGMRHWSNPTSTRIAIDLGGKVEYEAARVPNPDRIFFDLHGARLAPGLNGRQVEVIDDGYLKRIRAAQFHPDVTRVVLDVSDVSQYSAFLLPNPWRLIIDIHSDKGASTQAIARNKATANETLSTGASVSTISPVEAPPLPSARSGATRNSDSTVSEVAKLSSEPAKIPATAGPTSGPVSAKVQDRRGDFNSAQGNNSDNNGARVQPALPSSGSSTGSGTKKGKKGRGSASSNPIGDADVAAADNAASAMPHAADPTADGQRSLVRALGLKVGRIVIDAGHGGHDSGTLGPGGIQEKDVVLDVALRVGKLLHQQLGAEIVYTRDTDVFIPLETRTAIANKAQADLFLSIHGNSSSEPAARGVETYYLNFTSDPGALDVAARENAVSTQSVHQLSDLVRKITLKDKIDESREFAADVDQGLYAGLKAGNPGLKDRGVKKAPFVVLIGAQMPSILAEISFLTNPDDAVQLREGAYRQRIAEALGAGVERYLHGLSGTRPQEASPGKSSRRRSAKTAESGTELPSGN
jgi:N-acetylmuramoyl-L-alanine amidase